jgi:ABC-2 type transport system ATP-binding protein
MIDEPGRIRKSIDMPMIELASPNTRAAKGIVAEINGVISVSMYGDRLHIGMKTREVGTEVLEALRAHGVEIEGEREIVPSLEDVFIVKLKKEQ